MRASPGRKFFIAYCVVGVLMAAMMFFSASGKLTKHPGVVKLIHETVGVPLSFFPVLAGLEIAGGVGLLAGIMRPQLGLAGAAGLVLYFTGALLAHVIAGDFAGLKAPIVPFVLAITTLWLRAASMRRVTSA